MNNKYADFKIESNDSGRRIDSVIRKFLPNTPLKNIFKSIRNGDIRINSKKVKQNYRLNDSDILSIYRPLLKGREIKKETGRSIDRDRVVYEDSNILIYNKKIGDLVHGGDDPLDKRVSSYLQEKVKESLSFKPGPLHRLDRNTQGLIAFSVSLDGARTFSSLLKSNEIEKVYLTLVEGEYTQREKWVDRIKRDEKSRKSYMSEDGELAETHFIPVIKKSGVTLALMNIKTGRTHQIRVQSGIHNRPLVGDNKYNDNKSARDYFLSAISLTFGKNSGILNIGSLYLELDRLDTKLIKTFFNKKELELANRLIRQELNI